MTFCLKFFNKFSFAFSTALLLSCGTDESLTERDSATAGETLIVEVGGNFVIVESSFVSNKVDGVFNDYGFVLSKNRDPKIHNAQLTSQIAPNGLPLLVQEKVFGDTIYNLEQETEYFIRSFVTDSSDSTFYGAEAQFKTSAGNVFSSMAITPYPVPDSYGRSIAQFGKDLIFAGGIRRGATNEPIKDVYRYDLETQERLNMSFYPGVYSIYSPFVRLGLESKAYLINAYEYETWEFDLLTNLWARKADLPMSGPYIEAFSFDGKIYAGFPTINSESMQLWSFDPVRNQWTQLPNVPLGGSSTKEIFIANGKIHYFFSADGTGVIYEFNHLTNHWKFLTTLPSKAPFGDALDDYSFVLDDKVYIHPGFVAGQDPELWRYDVITKQWLELKPTGIRSPGFFAKAFISKGQVYIISEEAVLKYVP